MSESNIARREHIRIEADPHGPSILQSMRRVTQNILEIFPTEDDHRGILETASVPYQYNPLTKYTANMMSKYTAGLWSLWSQERAVELLHNFKFANHPSVAVRMWKLGSKNKPTASGMHRENGNYFTHNEDGTLNQVSMDDILPHFAKGKTFPNLVFTSNHARCNGSDDLSEIMKCFSQVEREVQKEGYQLERKPTPDSDLAGKTVLISNLHTEDHQDKNGAALIYRYNLLKSEKSLALRMNPDALPARDEIEREKRRMSPAAIQLGKAILKLMVENPDTIDATTSSFIRDDMQALPEGEKPILRADAVAIAKKIKMEGFSKGGNTVCDAARYMMYELRGIAHEQPVFAQRTSRGEVRDMHTDKQVCDIMSHIPVITAGSPDIQMTEEEHQLGMRRLRVNSKMDIIVGHFVNHERKLSHRDYVGEDDKILWVKGVTSNNGHDPKDALGFEGVSGYMLQDPTVIKRIQAMEQRAHGRG